MSTPRTAYPVLLNALVEMQDSPAYAVRRQILMQAESTILSLENRLSRVTAERDEARAQMEAARFYSVHANNEAAGLRLLMDEAITTMSHAEIFIETREKMHPTGVKLYGDLIDRMREAIAPAQQCGSESAKHEGGV